MNEVRKYKVDQLQVKTYATRLEMGKHAAHEAAKKIKELLSTQDMVNIIFAAAPSQNEFLSSLCMQEGIDWRRINAFHMDEYMGLAPNAPALFGQFLKERIFDKVPFNQVHYINGNADDPALECKRYEELLKKFPADIVCMGIGENTHIAFNDPHVADFNDPQWLKEVVLDDMSRQQQVHDGCFKHIDEVPVSAITLTVPALFQAKYIFCMVPGLHKAPAVYHSLQEPVSEQYPSTILRKHPNATLYLDIDSASGLH
ncbi:MAG: glucosamine-6-phosphate deaminase [Bacteroidetes bacterium]|nr:glucosamine-6-phosphate deaminase [Bacteroidota bacterium]